MHESGLHYYVPEDEEFVLVRTVTGKKESCSKQHIKADEQSRGLYASLGYTSVKDYKRVIQCNQIKDFPVRVQDIDKDHKI